MRLIYDSLYFHGQQVAAGDIPAAEVVMRRHKASGVLLPFGQGRRRGRQLLR